MRRIDDVILRPLLTEKATALADTENTYLFEVGTQVTKIEIKEAVQQLFSVRVVDVRTMVVRGKEKRFGRHFGKRSNWKKAMVTVAEGDSLDFYSGI